MFFPKKNLIEKNYGEDVIVWEYSKDYGDLPMDGALSFINGKMGPKKEGFAELFFCLSGELDVIIEDTGEKNTLKSEDMFIVPVGIKHTLIGRNARILIVCNPPFDPEKMEFFEE